MFGKGSRIFKRDVVKEGRCEVGNPGGKKGGGHPRKKGGEEGEKVRD